MDIHKNNERMALRGFSKQSTGVGNKMFHSSQSTLENIRAEVVFALAQTVCLFL
jgi:hypothetical protein